MSINNCFHCGEKFVATRSDQMFCTKGCRYRYYHPQKGYIILPIKKKWFDMIRAGVKKEEYREIKPYWEKRFKTHFHWNCGRNDIFEWHFAPEPQKILFRNGYGKDAPEMMALCTIREGTGKEEWGAEKDRVYYILEIKEIIKHPSV